MLSIRGRGGSPRPGVGRVTPMHSIVAAGSRDGCIHLYLARGWVTLGSVCGAAGSELARPGSGVPDVCTAAGYPTTLSYDASEEPTLTAVWSNGCTTVFGIAAWSDGYRLCEPVGWGRKRRPGSSGDDSAEDGDDTVASVEDEGEAMGEGEASGEALPLAQGTRPQPQGAPEKGAGAASQQQPSKRRAGTDALAPSVEGFAIKLLTLAVLPTSHGVAGTVWHGTVGACSPKPHRFYHCMPHSSLLVCMCMQWPPPPFPSLIEGCPRWLLVWAALSPVCGWDTGTGLNSPPFPSHLLMLVRFTSVCPAAPAPTHPPSPCPPPLTGVAEVMGTACLYLTAVRCPPPSNTSPSRL
jgi:hypothetical protein